jgi:lipoteichoic acid synthase
MHTIASENDTLESLKSRSLLSPRDWAYLLSLLIPFGVYDLVLKSLLVFSRFHTPEVVDGLTLMQADLQAPTAPGLVDGLRLMQSNLLFNLAYVLLWVALFALARQRLFRWIVVGLFHVLTILVVLITTSAYQYYKVTGSTLDFNMLLLGLSSLDEISGLIASEVSLNILVLVFVILVYAVLGPPLAARFVSRWSGWPAPWHPDISWRHWLRALSVGVMTYPLFSFSLLPGGSTGASTSFARHAFVNVIMTAVEAAEGEELPGVVIDPNDEHWPSTARLLPTSSTERRNIVVIFLESTRAGATTPYNTDLPTTPFMAELAKRSLVVEKAYAIVPHTHNAVTTTTCGIEPPLDPRRLRLLAIPGIMPDICLPHLLQEQGYNTVFFKSTVKDFEHSQQIIENLGYEDFYALEHMDTEGFEPTNYFGYEDEIMLEPSRAWLETHRDAPFLAAYLTSAPHHDYLAPHRRYERVKFTDNDVVNRYLNSVRNQDFFLKQLFEQYKQLGLYDDTIFIVLGDHGEGFGEHGRFQHDNVIYEEGLRIPLLIHDPQRFQQGARLEQPATQLDILPTVADLLGYAIQGGSYSGSSLLRPLPNDRTLMFSCLGEQGCIADLKGTEKYIYHFDDQPEELFDLATDPAERKNLAGQRSAEELNRRRSELLAWWARVQARYDTRAVDE